MGDNLFPSSGHQDVEYEIKCCSDEVEPLGGIDILQLVPQSSDGGMGGVGMTGILCFMYPPCLGSMRGLAFSQDNFGSCDLDFSCIDTGGRGGGD